ncbi:LacI family DNA-binding transcriptional regulator [Streptomyces sp. ACA25]|uniref:LacI family DNA-binding transcriptional regulator n=1 Tax=Streptomyces sp. ACA25 TaxID=3022596 RepID=UPI002307A91F|nr:LacI family DNA-binding transcriptional regulator [Streptomyces sp. ACA25]MDB1088703.1 LacI family DNA-binding transcriptional regulator [Streptomyces sp. ACA25]
MTAAARSDGDRSGGPAAPVTQAMVARRAGVSTQTVSNALNHPHLLNEATLTRVRGAMEEMGYRPHRAAQTLRTRSSKLIGYGVPPSHSGQHTQVMDRFLRALSATADEAGYRILLFAASPVPGSTDSYGELLDSHSLDGFVLSETVRDDRRQAWLAERGIPFVAFGRRWAGEQIGDWVDVDGAAGTAAVIDHLVARGHQRIAFLGWPRGSGAGDDRAEGWQRAMERHGLPTDGLRLESIDDPATAQHAVAPLFDRDSQVTAVVAASDLLALGCYEALRACGMEPGRDVAVSGFDDASFATVLSPRLTSVAQPLEKIGKECVRMLVSRMREPERPAERRLLAPALVPRGSTCPLLV